MHTKQVSNAYTHKVLCNPSWSQTYFRPRLRLNSWSSCLKFLSTGTMSLATTLSYFSYYYTPHVIQFSVSALQTQGAFENLISSRRTWVVAGRALGLVTFPPLHSLSVSWSLLMWRSCFMLPQPQLWAVLTAFSAVKGLAPSCDPPNKLFLL